MDVREAMDKDMPAVVNLLKLSLGEELMPKSEGYWRWKHVENPFGRSLVLLGWEGGELIGIRAFMRWQWCCDGHVYNSVRAVDTATHPEYQGRGIFKKLTLDLVAHCKALGIDFVFNTPNSQSMPGYLKMGWEVAGKLPVRINISRPFNLIKNIVSRPVQSNFTENANKLKYYLLHPKLAALLEDCRLQMKDIMTNTSVSYLTWRYIEVPVVNYLAVGEEEGNELTGLILGRIKDTRWGRELRITDGFLSTASSGLLLRRNLQELSKENNIDYITLSGNAKSSLPALLPNFAFKVAAGPSVTVRALALNDLSGFKNFNKWSPSLGDLELF